jgi:hypothetical protein
MSIQPRARNALLGLAAAAILAGVLVVVLGDGGGGGVHDARSATTRAGGQTGAASRTRTAVAAEYLGLSPAQLRRKLRDGLTLEQIASTTSGRSAAGLLDALAEAPTARLDRARSAGKLSAAALQARVARLRRRIQAQLERIPGYPGLAADARYLEVSAARLRSRLRSGQSLAQIANATPGKSAAELISTRVRDGEASLAALLAAGRISKTSDSALRSSLRARITREVIHQSRA